MLFIPLIIFLVLSVILFLSLNKKSRNNSSIIGYNKISIVVAVKNESTRIAGLIKALKHQDYNKEFFEVVIVDDNSTDDTYKKVEELITNHPNFHLIRADNKKYKAKKGALDIGISKTKFDYILITDGDCVPESDWVESYSKAFNADYDFAFGKTPIIQENNFINKVSRYENLRNSILMFSAANLGMPYCAYGRNFGFNKKAFEELGGYRETEKRLSGDDDLILQEAIKNKFKIGTVNSIVWSYSKSNIKDYILQRSRHTSTSHLYLFKHQLFLGIWHLLNIGLLFLPLILLRPDLLVYTFTKLIIDLVLILKVQAKFSYSFCIKEIIYSQIIYDTMIIINFFSSFFNKDKWK